MKQIKYFKAEFDKKSNINEEQKTTTLFLPDSRRYFTFSSGDVQIQKLKNLLKKEDLKQFYVVTPFASDYKTPSQVELVSFDFIENEVTTKETCRLFNNFYRLIMKMTPSFSTISKSEKELTIGRFTIHFNLISQIFNIYYKNDQSIVFNLLNTSSFNSFIMGTKDLQIENDTKNWLSYLTGSIKEPIVDKDLLDERMKLKDLRVSLLHILDNYDSIPKRVIKNIEKVRGLEDIKTVFEEKRSRKLDITIQDYFNLFKEEKISMQYVAMQTILKN